MKFSCEKALLQNAIGVASRAVSQKSSIPALEGLLLHTGQTVTVSGYNMQTGIRTTLSADVTEPGELVLNARLFGDIIRRMPDDVITFSSNEKMTVHLHCGDADFNIMGLSAADYPELPEVEDEYSLSIQQRTLRDMIGQTLFAVSTNESRPIHTGSLFEVGDTQLICRRLEGEFLDYKSAVPRKNPICVEAETRDLIQSIDRVSVVISEKLKSPVRCLFEKDRVTLSARTANGEAKDVCRLDGDGGELEIGFNNRYLMEALRYAPADRVKIELNTGVSPAVIVPTEGEENFLYMVLPVRLKAQE